MVRSRRMRHGIASSVHALEVAGVSGLVTRLVLKVWVREDASEPDPAGREARILGVIAGGPVPVPRLIAVDPAGGHCGAPALLMTHLQGQVVLRPRRLRPWISRLAALLPQVHSIPCPAAGLPVYSTYPLPEDASPPAGTSLRTAWEDAIRRVQGPPPIEPAVFIHRDFHPGNVLWTGSRVSGVVDWQQGCLGPPAADVGHCRWNLWYLHGREAAEAFLEEYERLTPAKPKYDRYWDLAAALGGNSLRFDRDTRSLEVAEEIVRAAQD